MEPHGPFRDAWRLYRAHFRRVVATAAGLYGVFTLLAVVLVLELGPAGAGLAGLLWLTGGFWLQAPLAQLVADLSAGRPLPGPRATADRILPHASAISLAGLLAGIGVGLGLYLLVLPGLFLLTRWSLLVPVIVCEDVGAFRAFARSRDLVRGHGFRIFGTILATVGVLVAGAVAVGILASVPAALGAAGGLAEAAALAAAAFVVASLVTPLVALAWTFRYLERRAERPPVPRAEWARLPVSETLEEAWAIYKRHPARLLVLGATAAALVLGSYLLPVGDGWHVVFALAATLVGYVWLAGLLAGGLATYDEAPPRAWLALRAREALGRALPLLALGIVGAALFVTVVGVVALVWLSVAGAVVVAERVGPLAALRRSAELVRGGRRRRVLKLVALTLVVALLASVALTPLAPEVGGLGPALVAVVATALTAPYVGLAWALMFGHLRELSAAERPAAPVADVTPA